jgi:hypothetical protein
VFAGPETDLEFGWPPMVDHTWRLLFLSLATVAAAPGILLGIIALITASILAGDGRRIGAALTALIGVAIIAFSLSIFWVVHREREEYKRSGDWEVWPFLKSADVSGPHCLIDRDCLHRS